MPRQTPPTRKEKFGRRPGPNGTRISDHQCDGPDCSRPARCRARAPDGRVYLVCQRCWLRVKRIGAPIPPPAPVITSQDLDRILAMRAPSNRFEKTPWSQVAKAIGKPQSTVYAAWRKAIGPKR
jgi:hypothetical protein